MTKKRFGRQRCVCWLALAFLGGLATALPLSAPAWAQKKMDYVFKVTHLAFSPDGKLLATNGEAAGSIIVWDVATGKPLTTLDGHGRDGWGTIKAFSPDG